MMIPLMTLARLKHDETDFITIHQLENDELGCEVNVVDAFLSAEHPVTCFLARLALDEADFTAVHVLCRINSNLK